MAVTLALRHWVAGAALGCAALTTALIPGQRDASEDPRLAGRPETARSQVGRAVGRAHRAALHMTRRDEVLVTLRNRLKPGEAPLVFFDPRRRGSLGEPTLRYLQARLDSALRWIAPLDSSVNVVLVVTRDTSYVSPGGLVTFRGAWYVLPEGTDGHTCLVMLPNFVPGPSPLGPCTFYAAFGRPGPAVVRWLQEVNYYPTDAPDWSGMSSRQAFDWNAAMQYMSWFDVMQGSWRAGLTLDASGCAAGLLGRCRALVESAPWYGWRRNMTGTMRTIVEPRWWRGDEQQGYLADLVRVQGRERFARFWRSPLPLDSAFADAYGMSMATWTHEWLRAMRPGTRVGPGIRVSSVLLGIVFAGVLVAGGAFYTMRRQIA